MGNGEFGGLHILKEGLDEDILMPAGWMVIGLSQILGAVIRLFLEVKYSAKMTRINCVKLW